MRKPIPTYVPRIYTLKPKTEIEAQRLPLGGGTTKIILSDESGERDLWIYIDSNEQIDRMVRMLLKAKETTERIRG